MIIGLMGQAGAGKDTAGAVLAEELGGVTLGFADGIKRWCFKVLGLNDLQLFGELKEKPIPESQLQAVKPLPVHSLEWARLLAEACCAPHDARTYVNSYAESAMQVWWNGLKAEPGLTPRRVMQHFGTEFVRAKLGPNFWIDAALDVTDLLLKGGYSYGRLTGPVPYAINANVVVITDVRFRNEALKLKRRGARLYGVHRPALVSESTHVSESEQLSVPKFWLDGYFSNRFDTKAEFEFSVRYVARNIAAQGKVLF